MSLSFNKRSSKHSPSCPLPKCPDPTPVLAALDQPPDEAAGSEGRQGGSCPGRVRTEPRLLVISLQCEAHSSLSPEQNSSIMDSRKRFQSFGFFSLHMDPRALTGFPDWLLGQPC